MVTLFLSSFTTRPTPIRAVRTSVVKRTKVNVDVKICHDRETRKTLASPLKIIKNPASSELQWPRWHRDRDYNPWRKSLTMKNKTKQNKQTNKQTNKNKSNKKTRADKGYLMFCGPISPILPLNLNRWLWPPWVISFAVNISLGGGGGEWGSSSNITVFRHNYNEATGKWLCEFSKVFQGLEKRMKGFSKHNWISVHISIPWKNSPL